MWFNLMDTAWHLPPVFWLLPHPHTFLASTEQRVLPAGAETSRRSQEPRWERAAHAPQGQAQSHGTFWIFVFFSRRDREDCLHACATCLLRSRPCPDLRGRGMLSTRTTAALDGGDNHTPLPRPLLQGGGAERNVGEDGNRDSATQTASRTFSAENYGPSGSPRMPQSTSRPALCCCPGHQPRTPRA